MATVVQFIYFLAISFILIKYNHCNKNVEKMCNNKFDINPMLMTGEDFEQRPCMCDEDCPIYGDCCPDAPLNFFPQSKGDEFSCMPIPKSVPARAFYLKNKCNLLWKRKDIQHLCENNNPQDILNNLYITNMKHNITYKSIYCALCNWDTINHLLPWKFRLNKPFQYRGKPILSPFNVFPFIYNKLLDTNCDIKGLLMTLKDALSVVNTPAVSVMCRLRRCRNHVGQCSKDWSDIKIKKACEKSTNYYYSFSSNRLYKNKFCAKCNFESVTSLGEIDSESTITDISKNIDIRTSPTDATKSDHIKTNVGNSSEVNIKVNNINKVGVNETGFTQSSVSDSTINDMDILNSDITTNSNEPSNDTLEQSITESNTLSGDGLDVINNASLADNVQKNGIDTLESDIKSPLSKDTNINTLQGLISQIDAMKHYIIKLNNSVNSDNSAVKTENVPIDDKTTKNIGMLGNDNETTTTNIDTSVVDDIKANDTSTLTEISSTETLEHDDMTLNDINTLKDDHKSNITDTLESDTITNANILEMGDITPDVNSSETLNINDAESNDIRTNIINSSEDTKVINNEISDSDIFKINGSNAFNRKDIKSNNIHNLVGSTQSPLNTDYKEYVHNADSRDTLVDDAIAKYSNNDFEHDHVKTYATYSLEDDSYSDEVENLMSLSNYRKNKSYIRKGKSRNKY